jgi:hypothetical protein
MFKRNQIKVVEDFDVVIGLGNSLLELLFLHSSACTLLRVSFAGHSTDLSFSGGLFHQEKRHTRFTMMSNAAQVMANKFSVLNALQRNMFAK